MIDFETNVVAVKQEKSNKIKHWENINQRKCLIFNCMKQQIIHQVGIVNMIQKRENGKRLTIL